MVANSIHPKSQSSLTRPRDRAAITLGLLMLSWLLCNLFFAIGDKTNSDSGIKPPQFVVDLSEAKETELRLLPHVGAKTAERWVEHRNDRAFEKPDNLDALEQLPQVGPKRAAELAPYLLPATPTSDVSSSRAGK